MEKELFIITEEIAQFSAKQRIGRELTKDELNQVGKYLHYAFEDWGIVLKDAVLKVTGAKELSQN